MFGVVERDRPVGIEAPIPVRERTVGATETRAIATKIAIFVQKTIT